MHDKCRGRQYVAAGTRTQLEWKYQAFRHPSSATVYGTANNGANTSRYSRHHTASRHHHQSSLTALRQDCIAAAARLIETAVWRAVLSATIITPNN